MTVIPDVDPVVPAGLPSLGDALLDEYVTFVSARCRPNTVLAVLFDLRVFFRVVGTPVLEVTTGDVLDFVTAQRLPRRGNVVRLDDGEAGMAASTVHAASRTMFITIASLAVRSATRCPALAQAR